MSFQEKLPEWFNEGLEPTTAQKNTGYVPGIKPPAQWFNWHLNRSYQVMKELQEQAVHREDFEPIEQRLNTVSRQDVTLQPGLQIIEAAKSAPFSLTELKGRMLVNLLGRYGGCEALGPWEANVALITDSTKRTSGLSSFRLSVGSATATASITFNTRPGLRYIFAADVEVPSGGVSASLGVVGATSVSTSTGGSWRQLAHSFVATAFFHQLRLSFTGPSGSICWMDSARVYEISETDYNALASMTIAERAAKYPYVDSVKPVRNPYAIRWTDANRTDIAAMLALQTDLYADPLTGANVDSVFERDGQYFKNKHWQSFKVVDPIVLAYNDASTGTKQIRVTMPSVYNPSTWNPVGVKYDGKLLPRTGTDDALTGETSGTYAYLNISNTDSGWGDSYTPTVDEIKAYFMGWVMYNGAATTNASPNNPPGNVYNGSGTKSWCYRSGGSGTSYAGATAVLPTTPAPNWTPYELVYQLALPTIEPIVSEGQLTLQEGTNQVEVGTGIVLREGVQAAKDAGGKWNLGNTAASATAAGFKNPATKVLNVYENGRDDAGWLKASIAQEVTAGGTYNQDAAYTVTYLMRDTSPVAALSGSVADNEKALLADLVEGIQQASTRVSVVENKKAEKDSPTWITPSTLLGGWTGSFNFGYRIEGDRVCFRGTLVPGTATQGQVLFHLPPELRTKRSFSASLGQYNTSTGATSVATIDFYTDGRVSIVIATAARIVFEGFSYAID